MASKSKKVAKKPVRGTSKKVEPQALDEPETGSIPLQAATVPSVAALVPRGTAIDPESATLKELTAEANQGHADVLYYGKMTVRRACDTGRCLRVIRDQRLK